MITCRRLHLCNITALLFFFFFYCVYSFPVETRTRRASLNKSASLKTTKTQKKLHLTANSRAEDGASRSAVRPGRVFRSGVRPGAQTAGAPGSTGSSHRLRGNGKMFYSFKGNWRCVWKAEIQTTGWVIYGIMLKNCLKGVSLTCCCYQATTSNSTHMAASVWLQPQI